MALVFCRSCKAKITQRDTTCPRCGSPTSRLVPIVTGIALSATALVLYAAFSASLDGNNSAVASAKANKATIEAQSVLSEE